MTKIISDKDKEIILREYWNKLKNKVKLLYFNTKKSNCQYCNVIKQLYIELSEMSNLLEFDEVIFEDNQELANKYNIISAPAVVIKGVNKGLIKFYGIPSGMEFPSFIDTIVKISRGETELSNKIIEDINNIIKDMVNIKVFITPTCPYCPKMVSTVFQFAIVSNYIDAEAWESVEFPDESKKYGVMAVPKIIINDELSFEGLVSPEHLLHYIYHALYGTEPEENKL